MITKGDVNPGSNKLYDLEYIQVFIIFCLPERGNQQENWQ
jgi:hypothetical protein